MSETFTCPNCQEAEFPDEIGVVQCPECQATITTEEDEDETTAGRPRGQA